MNRRMHEMRLETPEPESLRLVILEDEEAHFELMRRIIERELPSVSITHFTEPVSFLDRLDDIDPDVIIVDYLMPGMNGLEFLRELNRSGDRDIPVIMMTGQGSENVAIEAIRLGAWDYLVKSVYFFKLLPSTIGKVIRKRDLKRSLRESAQFNQLLMDSLPHPAMLIRSDMTVLAANRFAREMGAGIGEYCWRVFGQRDFICEGGERSNEAGSISPAARCTFCLADEALSTGCETNASEVRAFGRIWDTWWIPVEKDMFFHYALDITERKQTEEAVRASIKFIKAANRNSEMAPLLWEFIAEIKQFTGCRAVGIRLLDKDGKIPYAAHDGFSSEFLESESLLSINSDRGMCIDVIKGAAAPEFPLTAGGSCYVNRTSVCLHRLSDDKKGRTRNVCNRFGYESIALIPIRLGADITGLIHLADFEVDLFPAHMEKVLERAAIQLGTAIQRVHSEAALRQSEQELRDLTSRLMSAQEEERKRIAGELHDGLGSSLGAIKMSLENVRRSLEGGDARADLLNVPISWTQSALDEVRNLITDLRPLMLDDLGLIITLGWFVRQFMDTYPKIHIDEDIGLDEGDIPEKLKIVIFRTVQEALNNAAKYSGAEFITVSLAAENRALELNVEDNGEGFDPGTVFAGGRKRGLGLTSMKERIEHSGGTFSIQSVIGEGTAIRALWAL